MTAGLGRVQQQIITILAQAGQALWLRDLQQQLWGPQPNDSQIERTRQALVGLERRGLAWRAFAEWETYADQQARHRIKVWLPAQRPPVIRRRLRAAQVEQVILTVVTTAHHDRLVLTASERQWSRQFGPEWMPYSQCTNRVYQDLGKLTGESSQHRGRLKTAFYPALYRLEHKGDIQRARIGGHTLYIQRRR